MTIILGNIFAFLGLIFLGASFVKSFEFWKRNNPKQFFIAMFRGVLWAIGIFLLSGLMVAPFLRRCLSFSMPFQIYLILFFFLVSFISFSNSRNQRVIVAIVYVFLFFLLSFPAKNLGNYFYSPFLGQRLRRVDAYETNDHTIVYPSAWLDDLPIKDAVLDYWGWTVSQEDGKIVVIRPTKLWHSFLTGLYAIDAKTVRIWYPGGTIVEGIDKLELREKKDIPTPHDCLSSC